MEIRYVHCAVRTVFWSTISMILTLYKVQLQQHAQKQFRSEQTPHSMEAAATSALQCV